MAPLPGRLRSHRQPPVISLGRAIVTLYIITLLAAVISARTPAENELSQPGARGVEPHETASAIAGD